MDKKGEETRQDKKERRGGKKKKDRKGQDWTRGQ